jgi:SAM-dependent methyltransferase
VTRSRFQLLGRQLLNVDLVRRVLARGRFLYFARLRRRLRTLDSSDASRNTIKHNLKGLRDVSVRRSLVLIRPLTAALTISQPHTAIESATLRGVRVLSIGPRTEGELFNLVAHGFEPGLVRGCDLISYSPWIDLGDMHALPYDDDAWDAVVLGWVLAYSDRKQQAADEIVRVARDGAVVAVGVEYSRMTNEEQLAAYGYLAGSSERIMNLPDILKYFEGHIGQIYFSHDVEDRRKDEEVVALVAVFSIRK